MAHVRKDTSPLTDREEAFAKNFGKGLLTPTGAAKAAGYADPGHEITRLLQKPGVTEKVISYLKADAVQWRVLVARCKKVLQQDLDISQEGDWHARKIRQAAVALVLGAMKGKDGKMLEDAAVSEDAASNLELARQIAGRAPEPEQVQ